MIHRDVKPSNVLLTATDTALLADFGVMRMNDASELTATGDLVGTPLYMAPEQIESSVAEAPADLYALGVMLFEMVCGRTPFVGDPMAVLWQHVQAEPPDPRTLAPALPDATAELILRLLRKDPSERPSAAAVVAALQELAPDDQRPAAIPLVSALPGPLEAASRRPFVGRRDALSALRDDWERAVAGGPGLSLLVGEPGIGKSRLAAALAETVHDEHALVLYGWCDEEPLTSYQPFVQALRKLLATRPALELDTSFMPELVELGRLVPELRPRLPPDLPPATGKPQRYLLFEAVVSLLAAATAKRTPLLLVIDDLQWADESTLHLLRHVLDDPARAVTMVVATTRPEALQPAAEQHPLVAALDRVRRSVAGVSFDRLELEGLDDEETGVLVSTREQQPVDAEFVRRLHEATAGNPFFIEETLRGLRERDTGGDPVAALSALGVPSGAREVIQRRLARLAPDTVKLLMSGAVCGPQFRLDVVAPMRGIDQAGAVAALGEALAAGIIVEPAVDRYTFRHALIREALYAQVETKADRARMHLAAAEALEAVQAPTPELARHFHAAVEVGGAPKALEFGIAAAKQATAALAYEEAIGHCRNALEALDVLGLEHEGYKLLTGLGRLQWQVGEGAGARATFRRAADLAQRRADAEQFARAALGFAGRWYDAERLDEELIELLETALKLLPPGDSGWRARLLGALAWAQQFCPTLERSRELSAEAVAMATRIGDARVLLSVLLGRHAALLHVSDLEEREQVSAQWLRLAEQAEERDSEALALAWRCYDLCETGEIERARPLVARLNALAADLRQPLYGSFATTWNFVFSELEGDLDAAEDHAREGYKLATRAGGTFANSLYGGQLFGLHRDRGQLGELRPLVEPIVKPRIATWRAGYLAITLAEGHDERAREELDALAADRFAAVRRDGFWLAAMCMISESAVALDAREAMAELAAQLAPYREQCAQIGLALFLGPVSGFEAGLWRALGEPDRAEALLEDAVARCVALGARTAEQHARRELALLRG